MAKSFILNDLATKLDMKISALETHLGLSNGAISKSIKSNSDISPLVRERISEKIQNINKQWLETGEGEMFIQKEIDKNKSENTGVDKNNNPVTLNLNDQATMIVEFISLLREANSNMKIIAESNRTLAFTIKSISGNSKNQEEAESMEGKRQLKVKGK